MRGNCWAGAGFVEISPDDGCELPGKWYYIGRVATDDHLLLPRLRPGKFTDPLTSDHNGGGIRARMEDAQFAG
jgi:hypothetical protein